MDVLKQNKSHASNYTTLRLGQVLLEKSCGVNLAEYETPKWRADRTSVFKNRSLDKCGDSRWNLKEEA